MTNKEENVLPAEIVAEKTFEIGSGNGPFGRRGNSPERSYHVRTLATLRSPAPAQPPRSQHATNPTPDIGPSPPIIPDEELEDYPNLLEIPEQSDTTEQEPEGPGPRRPRLGQPPRGQRITPKADGPAPPLTGEQRLLLLDTWRRSGLPAGDFAALVGLSKHTLYAWKHKFERQRTSRRRGHLVAFPDEHSRFLVSYGLLVRQSAALVLEVFRAGLTSYGPPQAVAQVCRGTINDKTPAITGVLSPSEADRDALSKRPFPGLNRGMTDLQSVAFPLG